MKLHLPKMLAAALLAAITAVGSSAFADDVTTFTTTNLSSAGTTSNYNAQGFVITLDGARLESTSDPAGSSIGWCDEVNLVSITLNNLRNNPPSGDQVGLALADEAGKVLYLANNAASAAGKFTWTFGDNTTVGTDTPLYFYFYKTSSAPMTVGQTLTAADLYQNGCGGSGVSSYGSGSDSISCGFINGGVSSVQSVVYGPKLSIVATGIPVAPDKYVWAGAESGAAWDTQTQNWTVGGSAVTYMSAADTIATFGTEAAAKTVTVSENIQAGEVSVEDDYKFTIGSGFSLTVGKLAVADGKKATMAGEGTISLGSFTGALAIEAGAAVNVTGTITLSGTNTLQVSGEGTLGVTTLQVTGGTHTITNPLNVTGGGDGKGSTNRSLGLAVTGGTVNLEGTTHISGALYDAVGTVNIGNGKDAVRVTTNRVEFGDTGGSGTSTLNVNKNATLHIKGEDRTSSYADTALVMGEWGGVSVANISGKLYADNATAYVGDNTVTFNIENGGLMAVKGFSQNTPKNDKTETINLNLKDGGKLVLGANGIASQKPINVHFGAGEVGISAASVTIAKDIALSGTTTTFNTAQYVWEGSGDTRELVKGSTGGTLTITGNITGDGTITKTGEGSLVLSGTNNVLTHTIDAQEGSLTLSGGFEIGGIASVGKTVYGDGEHEGNGYATATGTVTVYSGDATVTATDEATFTYHGKDVDVIDGVYTLPGTQDTTTYYINSDTDSYSWIDEHKKAELTGGIVVAENGTLKADKEMSMSVVAASSKGTVEIGDNVVVTAAGGTQTVSLTGDGTYALASGSQSLGSVNTDDFDGWVRLTGEITDINLDGNLQDQNVEFNGVSKYFKNLAEDSNAEFTGDIRLTDADGTAALTINNGYSRKTSTYIFSGDISGEGKWELTNVNITQHYEFQGDLSDWTGEFNISGDRAGNAQDGWHNTSLTFSNEEGTVGAAITRTGGYLDLNINENTTFANTVTDVTSVIVEADKEVTFNAETSIGTLAGEGDVHAEQQLTLTGRTITSGEEGDLVFSGTLSASDLVVSGEVDLGGQLQGENIRVMSGGSLALSEGSQIIGDQPILNEGGTVSLSGIDVNGMQSQSGEEARFDLEGHVTWDDNYYMGTTADYVQVVMGGYSEGSVQWRDETYELADNGRITLGPDQIDYDTFYVGGQISTSDINASEHAEDIENINVEYGGTLTVDAVSNATIHAGYGATVAGEKAQDTVQILAGTTVEYADGLKANNGSAEFSGNVRVTNAADESTFSVTNVNMEVQADALTFSEGAEDALHIRCGVGVDSITNQSGQELLINNLVVSELSSVSALSGDIQMMLSTQGGLTVNSLEMGIEQSILAVDTTNSEVTVTVTETLTAGEGSTLYANLVLEEGATWNLMGSSMNLGSTLQLATLITLDDATLQNLDDDLGVGQFYALACDASGNGITYLGETGKDAWYGGVFSRQGEHYTLEGDFYLDVQHGDFGLVKVSETPEPTTGTLSLLALAALAARRRKHN